MKREGTLSEDLNTAATEGCDGPWSLEARKLTAHTQSNLRSSGDPERAPKISTEAKRE